MSEPAAATTAPVTGKSEPVLKTFARGKLLSARRADSGRMVFPEGRRWLPLSQNGKQRGDIALARLLRVRQAGFVSFAMPSDSRRGARWSVRCDAVRTSDPSASTTKIDFQRAVFHEEIYC
jgi:hypothetical protein